jgi:hypothetical protein
MRPISAYGHTGSYGAISCTKITVRVLPDRPLRRQLPRHVRTSDSRLCWRCGDLS